MEILKKNSLNDYSYYNIFAFNHTYYLEHLYDVSVTNKSGQDKRKFIYMSVHEREFSFPYSMNIQLINNNNQLYECNGDR